MSCEYSRFNYISMHHIYDQTSGRFYRVLFETKHRRKFINQLNDLAQMSNHLEHFTIYPLSPWHIFSMYIVDKIGINWYWGCHNFK